MRVTIYTDGGADPNPGIGGWAAILLAGEHEKILTGNAAWTTNNRMELQAAVSALNALNRRSEVDIYTDSEYLSKGITEWIERWRKAGWQRKGRPIPNAELWQQLWELGQEHEVEWHWVRGHAGNQLNNRVDQLARLARLEITPAVAFEEGVPHLYVRASCKGNPGPGGWGVVLELADDTEQLSGSGKATTNNRMELVGVINGLGMLPKGSRVVVHTTSDYVYSGATKWIKGWRKRDWQKRNGQPISNKDLWLKLDQLMLTYTISWYSEKGKGDVEDLGIREASRLASAAIEMES